MPRKTSPERQAAPSSPQNTLPPPEKPSTSLLSTDKTPSHSKKCTLCATPQDVLVRCQIDDTPTWHFVCPGSCWRGVSGGKVDGDASHPFYRYGGMWKNKMEAVSAKKPKVPKGGRAGRKGSKGSVGGGLGVIGGEEIESRGNAGAGVGASQSKVGKEAEGDNEEEEDDLPEWEGDGRKYTKNDRVRYDSLTWICRKSHTSTDLRPPDKAQNLWKEIVGFVED